MESEANPIPSPTTALPSPRWVQPDPNNPYPTTFVQADTSTFKQVVQMLTGTAETASAANQQPPAKNTTVPPKPVGPKKPAFKLYERRNSLKSNLNIVNPRRLFMQQEILSPSMLDFPSLVLSPVTPLIGDPFHRSAEEKAIAEKGFYLIPSPRSASETPRLLPLFPLTSPRASNPRSPPRD